MADIVSNFAYSGGKTQFGINRQTMDNLAPTTTDNSSKNNQSNIFSISSQFDVQAKALQMFTSLGDNYKGKKAFAVGMMAQCINITANQRSAYVEYLYYADATEVGNESGVSVANPLNDLYELTLKETIDFDKYDPMQLITGNKEDLVLNIINNSGSLSSHVTAGGYDDVESIFSALGVDKGKQYLLPVSPMYFTWKALYEDAEEKEKSNRAEEIARKLSGVSALRNNYEAIHRYCELMKINIYSDKINSSYDITGLITNVFTPNGASPYTVFYTNLATFEETSIVVTVNLVGKENYIISFNKDWTGSTTDYVLIQNDSDIEQSMWDALGADLSYDPKLNNDSVTDMDAKRNYDHENERQDVEIGLTGARKDMAVKELARYDEKLDTEIDSFKYRNVSSLGNLYLGMAKYAEKLENAAVSGSDDEAIWKRVKSDANIAFKNLKEVNEQQNTK